METARERRHSMTPLLHVAAPSSFSGSSGRLPIGRRGGDPGRSARALPQVEPVIEAVEPPAVPDDVARAGARPDNRRPVVEPSCRRAACREDLRGKPDSAVCRFRPIGGSAVWLGPVTDHATAIPLVPFSTTWAPYGSGAPPGGQRSERPWPSPRFRRSPVGRRRRRLSSRRWRCDSRGPRRWHTHCSCCRS